MPLLQKSFRSETSQDFLHVAVRSFTADSSLMQPTGGVNSTHLTRHMFSLFHICLHAYAWLKSQFWRPHITFHESSSCAHVVCLILFDFSTSLSLLFIFSLVVLSFLLAINFTFHDVVDKFLALSLMRTLALLPSTTLSQLVRCCWC